MNKKKIVIGLLNLAVVGLFLLWLPSSSSRPQTTQPKSSKRRSSQPHVTPKLTISGPATCQQGQTCNYTASGGVEPYTFTTVDGSVGSISTGGAYAAPAHVVPKQVINGCPGTPNNSIFNTRIDALPLHPQSAIWLSNTDPGNIVYTAAQRIHGSTVLSTDKYSTMSFAYTPQANGPFLFVPFPDTVAEGGTEVPGGLIASPGRDDHVITTYRDDCRQQEIYQLYQNNIYVGNPGGNSQSGVIYSLTNFLHPGYGTDAAGTYLSPLLAHLDEMLAAEAGNLDAVSHALRVDEDAASIDASVGIWPAQTPGGYASCGNGEGWPVIADGTATITGSGFKTGWPAGTPITIKGSNYVIASVNSASSITLTNSVPAGSHPMSLSHTACPPYGARFRLKASYVWPGFDGICGSAACQNVVKALLRSQQRYGLILADVGSKGEIDYDGGQFTNADIGNAFREIATKLSFGKDNFEIVDESDLNTNQGGTAADQRWTEAKLDNGLVTPDDAAVIKVTDGAANVGYYSVALQGVAIGVPNPVEVVMAGASPIQFSPWVTGSSNTGYFCSLAPSGGANGTMTSACLYTPPSTSDIKTRTDTTVSITAAADHTVVKTFRIAILPVAADGNLYISLGKAAYSDTYTDKNGIVWWSDMPPGQPLGLFPDNTAGGGDGPWTGANSPEAPGIYSQGEMGTSQNDLHFPVWVPNGAVTGTVFMTNFAASANAQSFSFDCNGTRVIGITDSFTYTGSKGAYSAAPLTCSSSVTNGKFHMVLRYQGINFQSDVCCTLPVYHTGQTGVWAAGLVIKPGGLVRPPRAPLPPRR